MKLGFFEIMFLIFMTLKLTGAIEISWLAIIGICFGVPIAILVFLAVLTFIFGVLHD